MTRNYEDYVYWTIPFKRGGKTHKAILEDAKERDTKQIPVMLSIRIEQFYELKERGLHIGGEPAPLPVTSKQQTTFEDGIEVLKHDPNKASKNFEEVSDFWDQ